MLSFRWLFLVKSYNNGVFGNFGVMIVEMDLLFDVNFVVDFVVVGLFDLVMVWLMGVYEVWEYCIDVMVFVNMMLVKYCIYVQNVVYELVDKVFVVGGYFQIVDCLYSVDDGVMWQEFVFLYVE